MNPFASSQASALSRSATVMRIVPSSGIRMFAPLIALNKASEYVRPIPITSPVDFISGPRAISTSPILEKENTGAFTAT